MTQFSQQNPVSIRIDFMRKQWVEKVNSSAINLIRWVVKPDELRMVEAFCLLEGSEHGQLPDLFIGFTNEFADIKTFDRTLTEDWIKTWENPDSRNQIQQIGLKIKWDVEIWKRKLIEEQPFSFLDCMSDFAQSIEGFKEQLVVYLSPSAYVAVTDWVHWVTDKIEHCIPPRIRLMISDSTEKELFKKLNKVKDTVHLVPNLNMRKAAREIATSGDPQNPWVQFNTCMFNLGDAQIKKSLTDINYWGKKAIEIANKNRIFNMEVAAGMAYGAALYQLSEFTLAIEKLRVARETAKDGIASGDSGCDQLFIQTFAFEAAIYIRKKDYKKAFATYQEMATQAFERKSYVLSANGWNMASYTAKKMGKKVDAYTCLQHGFETTLMLDAENIKNPILLLGADLFNESMAQKNNVLAEKVDMELNKYWGENWKEIADESKKSQKEYDKSGFLNFDFLKFTH